jgi:hypothetical protein
MRKIILFLFVLVGRDLYAQSPLCSSTATSFCCEYVASITINGQTYQGNTGFSGPGYYDYTGTPVPNINAGDQITISYTARTNGPYRQYFKFWFDFNGNGVLTDPGELVHDYNETISSTTKTFNHTFIVPTSVYNGEVYMRFIMQYSGSPTICGNYPYGNTFDFKTIITGATEPFSHKGYIYGANEIGIPNIPVKLYEKLESASSYTLVGTFNTDANGFYNLTSTKDTGIYDFKMGIDALNVSSPSINDAQSFNSYLFSQSFTGIDYYRMDVNDDGSLSITDIYLIFMKILGRAWLPGIPNYRFLTALEWVTISNSSSDLRVTYPGTQTVEINNIEAGDSTNFYLLRTGYYN